MKSILLLILILGTGQTVVAADPPAQDAKPMRTMRYTSRSAEEARQWQCELRAKLAGLLNMDFFTKNPKPAFDAKTIRTVEHDAFTIDELEINSTAGRRMIILVTKPKGAEGPFPGVVCIGGHSSTRFSVYKPETIEREHNKYDRLYKGFATVLAQRGYVTISTLVSQHEVYEEGATLMGERIWDLMRCVDYLESLEHVDNDRIGCGGLSLGGEMSMWLPAMDERIKASVSSEFLTVMAHMKGHCPCWDFPGQQELVDFADIYALIAPRPLQCQNGLKEPHKFFDVPTARKAFEEIRPAYVDLGHPENLVLDVHEGAHKIDLPGLVFFFEKHLQENRF